MPHSQHPIELLRLNTCGSVDDGKSTLIGRLLYDSKSIMEDQMEALERSADITGGGQINLANLTDGLRAERDFLLHGSGGSLVAQNDVTRWAKETGKPYGIYASRCRCKVPPPPSRPRTHPSRRRLRC